MKPTMSKTLSYTSFAIASILVVLAFITAKSYAQLAVAVILYPVLAYFALKVFPHKNIKTHELVIQLPARPAIKTEVAKREKVDVIDIDKRTFLKFIGATGVSFFLFSLLGKRVESLLFGQSGNSLLNSGSSESASPSQLSPMAGYRISEIDEGDVTFYGFTNKEGGWLIMKADGESNSFRYAKGGSGFPNSWARRVDLKYDYFYNLF